MTSGAETIVLQASCVALKGRAVAIEGPPGSGKTSLALALIDRGAELIGDDGVSLKSSAAGVIASAPPNIEGLVEIRGVGLARLPIAQPTPLALILTLEGKSDRLPECAALRQILGHRIPCLPFTPGLTIPALRAEWALELHGLPSTRQ